MPCSTCGLASNDLRAYWLPVANRNAEDGVEIVCLCAACRVVNAMNPRYIPFDCGDRPEGSRAIDRAVAREDSRDIGGVNSSAHVPV